MGTHAMAQKRRQKVTSWSQFSSSACESEIGLGSRDRKHLYLWSCLTGPSTCLFSTESGLFYFLSLDSQCVYEFILKLPVTGWSDSQPRALPSVCSLRTHVHALHLKPHPISAGGRWACCWPSGDPVYSKAHSTPTHWLQGISRKGTDGTYDDHLRWDTAPADGHLPREKQWSTH